jgi:hypothetical protein
VKINDGLGRVGTDAWTSRVEGRCWLICLAGRHGEAVAAEAPAAASFFPSLAAIGAMFSGSGGAEAGKAKLLPLPTGDGKEPGGEQMGNRGPDCLAWFCLSDHGAGSRANASVSICPSILAPVY